MLPLCTIFAKRLQKVAVTLVKIMKCKNLKYRSKQYIKYTYCTVYKKSVTLDDCRNCSSKEYKTIKPLKLHTYKQYKREKERFSIVYQDLTKCCDCGSKLGHIDKNEIFEGAYRQTSIKLGMVAPFCATCHNKFHSDSLFNLEYKVMFQREFLKDHSLEEFIDIFKQDYIYKLEQKKEVNNCLLTS